MLVFWHFQVLRKLLARLLIGTKFYTNTELFKSICSVLPYQNINLFHISGLKLLKHSLLITGDRINKYNIQQQWGVNNFYWSTDRLTPIPIKGEIEVRWYPPPFLYPQLWNSQPLLFGVPLSKPCSCRCQARHLSHNFEPSMNRTSLFNQIC